MIRHSFYIEQHKWRITTFFEVQEKDAGEILWHLQRTHASFEILRASAQNLMGGYKNNGMTNTSLQDRETIMVVGEATSGAEFFNSLWHELKHLEEQTSDALSINPKSEQAAYFRGGIAREIYPFISSLLCDCCRKKHKQKKPQ